MRNEQAIEPANETSTTPDSSGLVDIEYVTDLDGAIASITPEPWRRFALGNNAQSIADPAVMIGRSLESCLAGNAVQTQFQVLFGQVRSGRKSEIKYVFWCDSQVQKRMMRLTMTPVADDGGKLRAVRFVSRLLEQSTSAPNAILGAGSRNLTEMHKPILAMCSYCKRLEWPRESGNWLDFEAFEATGGPTDVRLSHGACADCSAAVMAQLEERA